MGMVRRTSTGGHALVVTSSNESREDSDEPEEVMAAPATSLPPEGEWCVSRKCTGSAHNTSCKTQGSYSSQPNS